MRKVWPLLLLELRSLYGINKFRCTKDAKAKNRYRLLLVAWVVLLAMVFLYIGSLVFGLCSLGLGEVVPGYLTMIASLLIAVFGLFTAGNRIFGQKGYDLLVSLPLRPGSIVLSRFLSLYIEYLVLTFAVLLPGLAVYGYCCRPGIGFYLIAALCGVFVPAIPLSLTVFLGTMVHALASRMKHKSMAQTLAMLVLVLGLLGFSFFLSTQQGTQITPEMLMDLASRIFAVIGKVYPPSAWIGLAAVKGDMGALGLFLLVSAAAFGLTLWIAQRFYSSILDRLSHFHAKHNYRLEAQSSQGLLKALYIRELKRYFSSSIYVTNTIIGPILGVAAVCALSFGGLEAMKNQLPMDVSLLLPFLIATVFTMMTTTCVSISMEGKQFWIVKSMPIPTKALLDSKLLVNLTLQVPCFLLSLAVLVIALRPGLSSLLWIVLIPPTVMVFSVVLGLTVNLKIHSFDWEKEETVVKQSLPAALGGFAGPLLSLALGAAVALAPRELAAILQAVICLVLWLATAFLYRHNNRVKLEKL